MIYILSEKIDLVTDIVIEWIHSKKYKFKRFNDDDFIVNFNKFLNKKISKIWLRRGTFNLIPNLIYSNFYNRNNIINYITREVREYSVYLEYILKKRLENNYIGSFTKEISTNNKLINLEVAKEVGFKTPTTIITSSKEELLAFYKEHQKIISKDLRAPVHIRTRHKNIVSTGVKLITSKMLQNLEDYFVPIFAQKYIEKKYEIRIFIFSKKLYAMAIFSQKDDKTKIDYRDYNNQKPNRCVPVLLPKHIEKKVWSFMKKVDMNTGSIDLIVTPKNEYYFLEINPMGQFHWLSANCNYYIEKDIADFLTDE